MFTDEDDNKKRKPICPFDWSACKKTNRFFIYILVRARWIPIDPKDRSDF